MSTEGTEYTETEPQAAANTDHTEPPAEHERKPPGLTATWMGVLAVAGIWCALPLWETLFVGRGTPGVYWLFIADSYALRVILVGIGLVALAEAVMVAVLALRKPDAAEEARSSRDEMTAACGIGFLALLLLVARLGMAQLSFSPLLDHHMGRVETGQHIYFLAHEAALGADRDRYSFVQCDTLGIWCSQIGEVQTRPSSGEKAAPQAHIEYNGESHAINVVDRGKTYYSYPLDH